MLKVKGDDMCATSDSQHWPFRCGGGGGRRWLNSGIELLFIYFIILLFIYYIWEKYISVLYTS